MKKKGNKSKTISVLPASDSNEPEPVKPQLEMSLTTIMIPFLATLTEMDPPSGVLNPSQGENVAFAYQLAMSEYCLRYLNGTDVIDAQDQHFTPQQQLNNFYINKKINEFITSPEFSLPLPPSTLMKSPSQDKSTSIISSLNNETQIDQQTISPHFSPQTNSHLNIPSISPSTTSINDSNLSPSTPGISTDTPNTSLPPLPTSLNSSLNSLLTPQISTQLSQKFTTPRYTLSFLDPLPFLDFSTVPETIDNGIIKSLPDNNTVTYIDGVPFPEGLPSSLYSLTAITILLASFGDLTSRVALVLQRDLVKQKDLARVIGVSSSTLSPLLRGKYKHTNRAHIIKLKEWLFERERSFVTSVVAVCCICGINQNDLSQLIQIDHNTISRWITMSLPIQARESIDTLVLQHMFRLTQAVTNDAIGQSHGSNSGKSFSSSNLPFSHDLSSIASRDNTNIQQMQNVSEALGLDNSLNYGVVQANTVSTNLLLDNGLASIPGLGSSGNHGKTEQAQSVTTRQSSRLMSSRDGRDTTNFSNKSRPNYTNDSFSESPPNIVATRKKGGKNYSTNITSTENDKVSYSYHSRSSSTIAQPTTQATPQDQLHNNETNINNSITSLRTPQQTYNGQNSYQTQNPQNAQNLQYNRVTPNNASIPQNTMLFSPQNQFMESIDDNNNNNNNMQTQMQNINSNSTNFNQTNTNTGTFLSNPQLMQSNQLTAPNSHSGGSKLSQTQSGLQSVVNSSSVNINGLHHTTNNPLYFSNNPGLVQGIPAHILSTLGPGTTTIGSTVISNTQPLSNNSLNGINMSTNNTFTGLNSTTNPHNHRNPMMQSRGITSQKNIQTTPQLFAPYQNNNNNNNSHSSGQVLLNVNGNGMNPSLFVSANGAPNANNTIPGINPGHNANFNLALTPVNVNTTLNQLSANGVGNNMLNPLMQSTNNNTNTTHQQQHQQQQQQQQQRLTQQISTNHPTPLSDQLQNNANTNANSAPNVNPMTQNQKASIFQEIQTFLSSYDPSSTTNVFPNLSNNNQNQPASFPISLLQSGLRPPAPHTIPQTNNNHPQPQQQQHQQQQQQQQLQQQLQQQQQQQQQQLGQNANPSQSNANSLGMNRATQLQDHQRQTINNAHAIVQSINNHANLNPQSLHIFSGTSNNTNNTTPPSHNTATNDSSTPTISNHTSVNATLQAINMRVKSILGANSTQHQQQQVDASGTNSLSSSAQNLLEPTASTHNSTPQTLNPSDPLFHSMTVPSQAQIRPRSQLEDDDINPLLKRAPLPHNHPLHQQLQHQQMVSFSNPLNHSFDAEHKINQGLLDSTFKYDTSGQ